jgi:CPA2 family monovalent cation:H+ antiporter-2
MRTHYLTERSPLLDLGASDVVAEEVEGAVEIISRLLRWIDVPRNVIEERIRAVRSETQTSDRKQTIPRPRLGEFAGLEELKLESVHVHAASPAAGKSPAALRLPSETGALVVGVRRESKLLESRDANLPFEPGDVVYLVGRSEELRQALPFFDPVTPGAPQVQGG